MKKVIIWGTQQTFWDNIAYIRDKEKLGEFKVLGVTGGTPVYMSKMLFSEYAGYKYYFKDELKALEFDAVIVMANGMNSQLAIKEECMKYGIPEEVIINYKVLGKNWFNLERYLNVRKNPPTIFAQNCWGGITYHNCDIKFVSPFINMFLEAKDYLKFLSDPKYYIKEEVELEGNGYDPNQEREYPIGRCGDIRLHFNHAVDFDDAVAIWERRKKRINWDNILVMLLTEDERIANEFIDLPYQKKICFVPFQLDNDCAVNINIEEFTIPLWDIVNRIAGGEMVYYDVLELLDTGKIVYPI